MCPFKLLIIFFLSCNSLPYQFSLVYEDKPYNNNNNNIALFMKINHTAENNKKKTNTEYGVVHKQICILEAPQNLEN